MPIQITSQKISNKEKQIPWFQNKDLNDREDIFCFHCEKFCCMQNVDTVLVQEKIENIELITDYIKIPQKEYEIVLDMALIISTRMHRYVISRGWYFEECLDINVDKNYDDIYPLKQVVEEWDNYGEWKVDVKRVVEKL